MIFYKKKNEYALKPSNFAEWNLIKQTILFT